MDKTNHMPNHSENTKRIAKNTIVLYIRMFFSMAVSLYTSRVVLNTLGVEDYGIYNVVGGVVAMFGFINGAMSGATSRFLTYELGRKKYLILKDTFATAIIVHIIIAVLVLCLAETIGLWFLSSKLVIPESRMFAAGCVYQFSVFASILAIIQVPYNACIIAHEKMNIYAYTEILCVLLKLAVVLLLQLSTVDKLILYALLLLIINVIIFSIYKFYSYKAFNETHFEFVWRPKILKSMLSFSFADLYGNASVVLRQQGVNMMLNVFFGPIVNAANGIATTVNTITMRFINNVSTAFRPQIIKRYASNEISEMFRLMKMATMICLILFLTVAIPLILEMEFVLSMWLGQLPQYSANFCRILLAFSFCTIITTILNVGIHATGKIYLISFMSGTIIWLAVPIIYYFLSNGYSPEVAYACNGVVSIAVLVINSCILKYNIRQFPILDFWLRGVLKCVLMCSVVFCALYLVYIKLPEGWIRISLIFGISCIANLLMAFVFILNHSMRVMIIRKLHFPASLSNVLINLCNRIDGRIKWEQIKFKYWRLKGARNQVKVKDSWSTIEQILKTECSVSRYGDGELDMIIHMLTDGKLPSVSGFQSYDLQLAIRLKEILEDKSYDDDSHIVCVPYWYRDRNVEVYKPDVQRFCKRYICEKLKYILPIINTDRVYFNANISRFYLSYKDKSHCQKYVEFIKRIWDGRNVCFIEGEYSRIGVGNNLFDNARDIKRILCPSRDAFARYEDIFKAVKSHVDRSTLLILAVGHTATVLAYDLAKAGYQAIDLGHIDVEYEWMIQNASEKVPLKSKYVNEATNGAECGICEDLEYNNQIIATIN